MQLNRSVKPVFKTMWRRLGTYFDGNQVAHGAISDDPLLDVVRQHPQQAVGFIRVTMLFGILSAVLMGTITSVFLMMYWTVSLSCNRPLNWWLLIQTMLQLVQVPVRVVFYVRLNGATYADRCVQDVVRRITSSAAWKTSKTVSLATYAWFVLGIVWIINSAKCPACPGIYWLSLAVACSSALRLVITLGFFYSMFPRGVRPTDAESKKSRAAPREVIQDLPVTTYVDEHQSGGCSTCSICISDFEVGELIKPLPCGHKFHQGCIDKWLRRSGVCPLCMREVMPAGK